jgi:hypothetical protein
MSVVDPQQLQDSLRPTPIGEITGSATGIADRLVTSTINVLLYAAGFLALVAIIWSGYRYITAGGDAGKASAARSQLLNAVIGLAVIVASFFFIRVAVSIGGAVSGDQITPGADATPIQVQSR